jgi:hypothetical protein
LGDRGIVYDDALGIALEARVLAITVDELAQSVKAEVSASASLESPMLNLVSGDKTLGGVNSKGIVASAGVNTIKPDITRGTVPPSSIWATHMSMRDSNGADVGYLRTPFKDNGDEGVQLETVRTVNGSPVYHGLQLMINGNGTRTVIVNDAAAWRAALGFGKATANGTADSSYISSGTPWAVRCGNCCTVRVDGMVTKAFSGRQVIGTVPAGFRPPERGTYGMVNGTTRYFIVETNGEIKLDGNNSAATLYGYATFPVEL